MYVWVIGEEEAIDHGRYVGGVAVVNWVPSISDDLINFVGVGGVRSSWSAWCGWWSLDGLEWGGSLLFDVLSDVLFGLDPTVSGCIVLFVMQASLFCCAVDFGLIVCDKPAKTEVKFLPSRVGCGIDVGEDFVGLRLALISGLSMVEELLDVPHQVGSQPAVPIVANLGTTMGIPRHGSRTERWRGGLLWGATLHVEVARNPGNTLSALASLSCGY